MTRKIIALLTLLAATTQLTAQPITVISSDEQRFAFRSELLPEQFAKYFLQMNRNNTSELRLENVHSELMPTLLELFRVDQFRRKSPSKIFPAVLTPILNKVTDIEQAIQLLHLVDCFNLRDEFAYAIAFHIAELAGDVELEFPEDGSLQPKLQRILKYCHAIVQNNDIFMTENGGCGFLIRPVDPLALEAIEYGSNKYALAQFMLGLLHSSEDGILEKQDRHEMAHLFTLALNQEYAPAQFMVGTMYLNAQFIDKITLEQDCKEALRLLTLAANQGHQQAQQLLHSLTEAPANFNRELMEEVN